MLSGTVVNPRYLMQVWGAMDVFGLERGALVEYDVLKGLGIKCICRKIYIFRKKVNMLEG